MKRLEKLMVNMETVELPRDDAVKLLTDKLRDLDNRIENILQRWNQPSTEIFLERARTGALDNAEMDAITLTNLLVERNHFDDFLTSIKSKTLNQRNDPLDDWLSTIYEDGEETDAVKEHDVTS